MAAPDSGTSAANNDDIVEMALHDLPPKAPITTTDDTDQNKHTHRICFAPTEQTYNHGSDRARPLRTMPLDPSTWIGNLDDLGSRVWPHPSFKELIARSLTGGSRFALPDTVAKETRFQSLRLRCCGDECCPATHSPPVEYERPSRLETLEFKQTHNVVIYPFYVRLSKQAGLEKLFAIVHRHENGQYRFWKADGTYHESYGLVKGSISMFPSPRSARSIDIGSLGSSKRHATNTPTKPAAQPAGDLDDTPLRVVQEMCTLTRSREAQPVGGQIEDPFVDSSEPPSKRRIVSGSSILHDREGSGARLSTTATSHSKAARKKSGAKRLSTTFTRPSQSGQSSTQRPCRSLLYIKEICMLAYHLTGTDLQLLYGDNAFTVESGEGALIDPTTEKPFLMTEQHAQYVLYSRQKSLKVVLSKHTTRSIIESPDEITGGVILLDFGGSNARDEFVARIQHMIGITGGIGCADDLVIETMYSKLLEQLCTRRTALFDAQGENATTGQESDEQIQSHPAKNDAEDDGREAASCPPPMVETSSYHVPATPKSSTLPTTSISDRPLQFSMPVKISTSPTIPQAGPVESTAPPASQAQDTKVKILSEAKIPTSAMVMMEFSSLLREVYVKYPSAQDDDQVEKMAVLLKASLLAGEQERVRELKMDMKVYLIAHHG